MWASLKKWAECWQNACFKCNTNDDTACLCSKPLNVWMYHNTVPMMNMVSCCVDVPSRLFGVRDLCCLGDEMLNIPPRQLRTGARDMKQNIIKRILPSARVLHWLKPQRKHFNSTWYSERKPAGSSKWALVLCRERLEDCFIGLTAHSIRHACNAYTVLMRRFIDT